MRLLIDANLSPRVAKRLSAAGFDVWHVADVGLLTADDSEIFQHAVDNGLVVVTADSDFGMMLAARATRSPSVVHLRHVAEAGPGDHASLLESNLPLIADDLMRGVIVSLSPTRLALRDLPIA